jgi:thiamine-monophosphate kinase
MRWLVLSVGVKSRAMDEFRLIDALVAAMGDATQGVFVILGPGDDGSITSIPAGTELVTSVDCLVEGVHFPIDAPAELVGRRALGVSVSDLAAMGATPTHAVISVTMPVTHERWLLDFARGIATAARSTGIAITGGNLARGPLNISVTAMGYVPEGAALRRSGAREGDAIFVSGTIGGAGLALATSLQSDCAQIDALAMRDPEHPLVRYYMPRPRLRLGQSLRGIASAAIDVSDGLLADLEHVCRASRVAARIDLSRLPLTQGATAESAIVAGDDYELLFCLPPDRVDELRARSTDVQVTHIGEILAGEGVMVDLDGAPVEIRRTGFMHFT